MYHNPFTDPNFTFAFHSVLLMVGIAVTFGWTWLILTRSQGRQSVPSAMLIHFLILQGQATLLTLCALAMGYRVKRTHGALLVLARSYC